MGFPSHNYWVITTETAVLCMVLGSGIGQQGMNAVLQILTFLNTWGFSEAN